MRPKRERAYRSQSIARMHAANGQNRAKSIVSHLGWQFHTCTRLEDGCGDSYFLVWRVTIANKCTRLSIWIATYKQIVVGNDHQHLRSLCQFRLWPGPRRFIAFLVFRAFIEEFSMIQLDFIVDRTRTAVTSDRILHIRHHMHTAAPSTYTNAACLPPNTKNKFPTLDARSPVNTFGNAVASTP